MSNIQMTEYFDEFLRYYEMANWQMENCNLNGVDYSETPFDDDLIKNVHIYDVTERKYAGFTQFLLDIWYSGNRKKDHPYLFKMDKGRGDLIDSFENVTEFWDLEEWLYIFFVHRLTGSGINYAFKNSGYHNSVLFNFKNSYSVNDFVNSYKNHEGPKFTSKGYQIAAFPKPNADYKRGGDYFMCEILPDLVYKLSDFLQKGEYKKSFRKIMEFLEKYNKDKGIRVFYFQYAATLADIADFFPEFVIKSSEFFYGKNAKECLKYLAEKPKGMKEINFLDEITSVIEEKTGLVPYNSEDVACDFIRWIENYVDIRHDYKHLDLDNIWNSSKIINHPFGRQKSMLHLNLVKTFNGDIHPHDDKILKLNNLTIKDYKDKLYVEGL